MENFKKATILDDSSFEKNNNDIFAPTQVLLPSRGKIYNSSSPLFNVDFLEVREMTAREEDILTSRVLLKKGLAIDKVLENCLVNKKIKQGDLLVGDRNAILLTLRILGFGSDYHIKFTCPVCNENQDYTFSLIKTKIKFLDTDPVESNKNIFEYKLPKKGNVVKFKFLTASEEADIAKSQENLRRSIGTDYDNYVTSRLIRQMISIDGNEDRSYITNFVNNMHIFDSKSFRSYADNIEPDVIMKNDFSCKNCGDTSEVDMPITTEFFWPTGI